MAGTSRATVNRVLREEVKLGAVALARGRTTVLDAGRPRAPLPAAGLAREVVQERAEQPVEALRARDAHLLAGRVRADDLGADRDHLDAGQLLAEDGAFEPAVDDCRARARCRRGGRRSPSPSRAASESRSGSHGGYERRTSISAPPSRASACIVASTPSSAAAFELRVIEPSVSAPSCVAAVVRLVLVSTTPWSPGVIATTPVGTAGTRSSASACRVARGGPSRPRLERDRQPVVRARELAHDRRELAVSRRSEARLGSGRDGDDRLRIARDRVSAHASVERDEPERRRAERGRENASERLDRVRRGRPRCPLPSARPSPPIARRRSTT